jgi:AcrR family transcriptional regulator
MTGKIADRLGNANDSVTLARVSAVEPVIAAGSGIVHRTAAQTRIITAALDLFGEHGVSGTSLQMIADRIGVTKAAVYHQFNTKEEIVIAVVEVDFVGLESALDAAEVEPDRRRAREVLLSWVIDMAVQRRRIVSALQQDPVIVRLLAKHGPFLALMDRLFNILTGGDPSTSARVRGAMISAAIGGAVTHPLVMDLDDETLRAEMRKFTRELFELPE